MLRILCVAALACLLTTAAEARHRHRAPGLEQSCIPTGDTMRPCAPQLDFLAGVRSIKVTMHRERHSANPRPRLARQIATYAAPSTTWINTDLVSRARSYMGTNPTGWRSLWCAKFMAMIAPAAAAKVRNPNYAKDWLALRHTSGHVGDIAVLGRRGGGHVGVVSGFDANGNPIIVSGNHGKRVGEGTYSRARVLAFVSAS